MRERIGETRQIKGSALYCAALLLLYAYFMFWPANNYLAESFSVHLYPLAVAAAAAVYYSRRGLRDGTELKLCTAYWVWALLSRLLCGDTALLQDFSIVIGLVLCCLALTPGLICTPAGREKLLLVMAALLGAFCFALACAGLATAIRGAAIVNPITEGNVAAMMRYGTLYRLCVMDNSPNVAGLWFYLAICLSIWLFAYCRGKKRPWRVLIVLAALMDYLALSLTYSRNVKIAFAVSVGMLALLLLLRFRPVKNRAAMALLLVLAAGISVPASYMSCGAVTKGVAYVSSQVQGKQETAAAASSDAAPAAARFTVRPLSAAQQQEEEAGLEDSRAWNEDSGRLEIYRSALTTLQREPLRLARGCLSKDVMSVANTVLSKTKYHFHNSYLQILVLMGLPGFALMIAFCVLLLIKGARLFCSAAAPLRWKLLTLPLLGSLLYNMLEVNLFMDTDLRSLSFFLLAGCMLGCWNAIRKS